MCWWESVPDSLQHAARGLRYPYFQARRLFAHGLSASARSRQAGPVHAYPVLGSLLWWPCPQSLRPSTPRYSRGHATVSQRLRVDGASSTHLASPLFPPPSTDFRYVFRQDSAVRSGASASPGTTARGGSRVDPASLMGLPFPTPGSSRSPGPRQGSPQYSRREGDVGGTPRLLKKSLRGTTGCLRVSQVDGDL